MKEKVKSHTCRGETAWSQIPRHLRGARESLKAKVKPVSSKQYSVDSER